MNNKVFLCHASEDKPSVRKLYHLLKSDGFNPWLDDEKLLPGQDWRLEIEKAVRKSNTIIVCLSAKSITKSGYVQKGIKYALDIADEKPEGEIYIIPAKLEECNVPYRLNRWHLVNLFEKDGYDRLLGSLGSKVTDVTEPEFISLFDNCRAGRASQVPDLSVPKVFISYKWEDDLHNRWVERLARDLRYAGIEAILDKWEVRLGDSFTDFMTLKINEADVILFIITTKSVAAVEGLVQGGAVKFEMQIATARRTAGEKIRIIGIYREGDKTPVHLRDHRYADFRDNSKYHEALQELVRDLFCKCDVPPIRPRATTKVTDKTEQTQLTVEDIIDEGLLETRAILVQSFVRWKRVELLPSIDKYKVITAYSDKLGDDLDNEKLAFMLKAALWYGHDVIFWAERNKENNEIIPILLEALQRPERRPFYRTGLAIEHLDPDFRGTIIKHIREQLPDNKEVETIVNKAEKNETLKFWEEDLPKIYEPEKAKQLVYRAKTSKRADYKTD